MTEKESKNNKEIYTSRLLKCLLDDPTQSIREIAKELKSHRQRVWRKKKELEEEKIIWGYTAVIDDTKMKHGLYQLMMKCKPMTNKFVEILIKRIVEDEPKKQNVIVKDMLYVNGEYDFIVCFSAPDHARARRYYNAVRMAYQTYLIEKPVMVNVDFPLIREGKVNPDLNKLYDLVPV
ncbi:MAG: Lrp/AsnC family transcriptional regulator [archaeon]